MALDLSGLPAAALDLIGPGGPYEVVERDLNGASLRLFRQAPPNLGALYRSALDTGDRTFYVYRDERYTFADAWDRAGRVVAGLRALGVAPGDRVGISLRNYPEWIWSFMGITRMGAVAVAMNSWWTAEEMAYGIDDSGLSVLIVDHERLKLLPPEPRSFTAVAVRTEGSEGTGALAWSDFTASEDDAGFADPVDPEAPATLLYTSGSTAHPKGVLSTHRAVIHALLGWEAAGALAAAVADQPPPELPWQLSMILTVPLFHVTGLNVHFLSSFRHGRKLVGMYKWDPEEALKIIERERITHFNGVPTMAWELVQSPNYERYDLSSLVSMGGGGAAMAPEHSRQISQRSVSPGTGYGMTETNGLGTAVGGPELLERPTSCGRPLPPVVDIKVVDHAGREVPRDETGEIWIRGPMNFSGYWNRAEDAANTLVEGWVRTGDIGHMDAEDFVYITDREKDMVIRGGENIGCQEVEAVIYEHPAVLECAVFGVPDERLGEAVAAAVTRKPGASLAAEAVRTHVAAHLARFKVPEHVWVRDEQLPRIASGKIFKRGLRAEAMEALSR
ncbi:MAG: class I adenylate-forming enzyme family protein [Gammaproteobacteria bacterium]|nr:class I adenylate-forming enzyme family protein [Gammaproteobacteria bacterium]MDD9960531.1 class I adenylate-forming enzyme family protein [Gammaproteobacteria bacterium]MDD9964171.1 class I adenylate-forming enzyme family protein [Gammaproteobacteria bacterium]